MNTKQPTKLRATAIAGGVLAVALAAAQGVASAQQSGQSASSQATSGQQQSGQMQAGQSQSGQQQQSQYRAVRANELIGMQVTNAQGANLGEINDLVVNVNTGAVRYAILSFNPEILTQETLFAVPLSELRMDRRREAVIYQNMDKERLAVAAIRRTQWGEPGVMRDQEAWNRIDKAYNIQQPTETASAMRVSDLLDRDLVSRAGEDIGEIESIVINMANQQVHYVVVDFDPGWLTASRRVAMPLSNFELARNGEDLIANVDRNQARRMQALDENWFANMNEPSYVAEVDRYVVTVVTTAGQPGQQSGGTQAMGAGGSPQFSQLDRNGDNRLDRSEVQSAQSIRDNWSQVDRDSDGWISQQEFQRHQQEQQQSQSGSSGQQSASSSGQQSSGQQEQGSTERMGAGGTPQFDQLDRDSNDRLDRSEVMSAPQIAENWNRVDADGDGWISKQEFQNRPQQQQQQSSGQQQR
ncbi:PRC-barrel domain-containing protein [Ramlibacter sp. AN1015]|uniref:PRC-barrel domain-containing protein n=1 Tax=Ramlibacter sp. AN1015 TaxID=3133428 RepID=UPI0030C4DE9B